jgi:hypothetical protein
MGWVGAAARTGLDRRGERVGGGSAAASLVRGPRSKSSRGRDPAKGAVFITPLGKRVPSHCHPSRGLCQPIGTQQVAEKVGGGLGLGLGLGLYRVFFFFFFSWRLCTGHNPVTSRVGLGLSGAFLRVAGVLLTPGY